MILVKDSAPDPSALGATNGLCQFFMVGSSSGLIDLLKYMAYILSSALLGLSARHSRALSLRSRMASTLYSSATCG